LAFQVLSLLQVLHFAGGVQQRKEEEASWAEEQDMQGQREDEWPILEQHAEDRLVEGEEEEHFEDDQAGGRQLGGG
jgi:hypothetical protein